MARGASYWVKVAERSLDALFVGHAVIVGSLTFGCTTVTAAGMGDEVGPPACLDAHRRARHGRHRAGRHDGRFEARWPWPPLAEDGRRLRRRVAHGWAFSAFMLANFIGITVAGHLADAAPRRHSSPPCVVRGGPRDSWAAPSMAVVVVGRAVQGWGGRGARRGLRRHRAGLSGGALRPSMFAVMSSAQGGPWDRRPRCRCLVAEHPSWRLVFLGLLPLVPLGGGLLILVAVAPRPHDGVLRIEHRHRGAAGGARGCCSGSRLALARFISRSWLRVGSWGSRPCSACCLRRPARRAGTARGRDHAQPPDLCVLRGGGVPPAHAHAGSGPEHLRGGPGHCSHHLDGRRMAAGAAGHPPVGAFGLGRRTGARRRGDRLIAMALVTASPWRWPPSDGVSRASMGLAY